jgi:hypothetical protein
MKNVFGRTEKNWYLETLEQGQRVKFTFDNGETIHTGKICGISSNSLPVMGKTYIVEPDNKIGDYSHVAVPEILMDVTE